MARKLSPSILELGANLRAARERARLTQEEVSAHLHIPRSAVSESEQGKREVSAAELYALARLYGEPMEALLGVREPRQAGERFMFRAEAVSAPEQHQLTRFLAWCAEYRQLEEQTGDLASLTPRPALRPPTTFEQAHRLADEERKRLELGVTPGRVLLDVLEEQTGGRQVFTLAHEYFHLLTGPPAEGNEPGVHVCDVLSGPAGRKSRDEQLADQFAGRLLLPPEPFIDRLQQLRRSDGSIDRRDLIDVARYFGVSVQAVFVALARLKLVSWELVNAGYADDELQQAIVRSGGEQVPEPKRFRRLAVKAYRLGAITRGRLAELLEVGLPEVAGELDRYGGEGGAPPVKLAPSR
ncbi:MAG: ImmA/IrrE family metallo-endopeptidase [Gemmatimonadetes bacterium]|nr:ImmA/IrrE family metallo-endopeptidase [Gemmatimonadota bacterium]